MCKRINDALLQSTVTDKAGGFDLGKSLECFITELTDTERDVGCHEAVCLFTSVVQVSNISCYTNNDNHIAADQSTSETKSTAKPCCICCVKITENIDKLSVEIVALN